MSAELGRHGCGCWWQPICQPECGRNGACTAAPQIENGRLCLGTWQGIYLCEHRNRWESRRLVLTVHGE